MNRRLILAAIAAFVLFVVVLVIACSPKNSSNNKESTEKKITLTYWRLYDDQSSFDKVIQNYEKSHSNIRIEYKKLDPADYEKTLLDAIAAGRGPDLFSVNNYWMPRYFDKAAPAPEKDWSPEQYARDFFPVASQDNVKDGRIYGVPLYIDNLALFVNPVLLGRARAEYPETWEDLVGSRDARGNLADASRPGQLNSLNKRNGLNFSQSAIALGGPSVTRGVDILSLMMLQDRTNMVNADHNQALFNLKQKVDGQDDYRGTRALKLYGSFSNPRSENYSWNGQFGNSVKAFAAGKVAYMINYSYVIPTIDRLNPKLEYTIRPMLQIGGTDPVNFANYWTEVVSKASAHQAEAWDFLKFITNPDNLYEYTYAAGRVPSRHDVQPPDKVFVFYKQNQSAVSWYKGDANKVDKIFLAMINQVIGGDDPQRAIDAAANQVTDVLRAFRGSESPSF